jgi:hypothetical protein
MKRHMKSTLSGWASPCIYPANPPFGSRRGTLIPDEKRVLPRPLPFTAQARPENPPAADPKTWVDRVDTQPRQVDRVVRSEKVACGWRAFGAYLGGGRRTGFDRLPVGQRSRRYLSVQPSVVHRRSRRRLALATDGGQNLSKLRRLRGLPASLPIGFQGLGNISNLA